MLVEAAGQPESLDDGDEVTESISSSETLQRELGSRSWIDSTDELHRIALQSLGRTPGQSLEPVSNGGGLVHVEPGDLLVRSALLTGGQYSAVIVSERPESAQGLLERGVPVEPGGSGWFVQVVEVPSGGGSPRTIGRRLTDGFGRMLRYQKVLRHPEPERPDRELPPLSVDEAADLPVPAETDVSPQLEEAISIDDVAAEMNGLRCRFLVAHPATASDGSTRTFASGAQLPVQDWQGTNPDATVAGFPVPKLVIAPAPAAVAGIRRYDVALTRQRTAVQNAQSELSAWVAQEGSYRRNHAHWEAQRVHLAGVATRKSVIYSQMWVRQMMYNRFDSAIDTWTRHYNTQLRPATNLDPNVVKSMAYQESRMGTSGPHLMPPPSDWTSGDRHPVRSRFNIIQAIDSFGPQQWLMMREMAPTIFTHHGLNALGPQAVWLGMTSAQYGAHPTFMTALREFFTNRTGANNLMGTPDRDLHEDYGYWIRAAIRWLFEKFARLPNPTWREAVRAYNGSGAAARTYRDAVMARVGSTDPFATGDEVLDQAESFTQSETFTCSPVLTPDPERRCLHPKVYRRGAPKRSLNGSVGRAQELLNVFLSNVAAGVSCPNGSPAALAFISSSLSTLSARGQNPIAVDCNFGESTELATKMFQACRGIAEDGIIGPITWALLETLGSHPTPVIRPRPCCILAPDNALTGNNILDPGALGTHATASEVNGLVYCGKAGFVDLGHARDMIDLTKFIHDQLTAGGGPPRIIRTLLGIASIRRTPADALETAAAIAFEDSRGHEIFSWDTLSPGFRNSAFSPEDLVSNFVGTLVGRRAISAGGSFSAAATNELKNLLTSLDVQTEAESDSAFNLINGRWVNFTGAASLTSNSYLLRRNFTRQSFKTGHSSDAATPDFVKKPFSARALADFDYFHLEGGRVIPGHRFSRETERVKREAEALFGSDFDKP